jgi:hypothetical protein
MKQQSYPRINAKEVAASADQFYKILEEHLELLSKQAKS